MSLIHCLVQLLVQYDGKYWNVFMTASIDERVQCGLLWVAIESKSSRLRMLSYSWQHLVECLLVCYSAILGYNIRTQIKLRLNQQLQFFHYDKIFWSWVMYQFTIKSNVQLTFGIYIGQMETSDFRFNIIRAKPLFSKIFDNRYIECYISMKMVGFNKLSVG